MSDVTGNKSMNDSGVIVMVGCWCGGWWGVIVEAPVVFDNY